MLSASFVRTCVRADASTLWKHKTYTPLFGLSRLSQRSSSFLSSISAFVELSASSVRTCVHADGGNSRISHTRSGVFGLRFANCANVGGKQCFPRGINSD